MILPDLNVLVYAYREDMADHDRYRDWLTRTVNAGRPYGVSELVLSAFVRVVTNRRVFRSPSAPAEALSFTRRLLSRPVPCRSGPGRDTGPSSTACAAGTAWPATASRTPVWPPSRSTPAASS